MNPAFHVAMLSCAHLQVPFATHTACTIEIASLDVDYDVAVIDEIQVTQLSC